MYDRRSLSCNFLRRLARNAAGNVMALTAAAIIPMIGLVGGAIDASRLYATKSRLQSACDAGALAGRRTMGSGQWSDNSNRANVQAQKVFDLNFPVESFGSEDRTRSFSESRGTVTGTATADVPMTLMQVFNMPTVTITVTCTSEMVIPNTDVMFVLDVTGSMNCEVARPGYNCSNNGNVEAANAKIKGLRTAVKCFYEALARLDSEENCGPAPAGGLSAAVQLRFGFMPYASNVNVGKLLPNSYFADNPFYQSRTVSTEPVWAWEAGTESAISGYGNWNTSSTPSSYNTASGFNNWSFADSNATVGGVTLARQRNGYTSSNCASSNNTLANSSGTLAARSDLSDGIDDVVVNETTPTYPNSSQTRYYEKVDGRTVTAYRYRWFDPGWNWSSSCYLEVATRTYDRKRTGGTSTRPLTWKQHQKVTSYYTYERRQHDITGLKAGGSSWNSTVNLPLNVSSTFSIYPSGSKTSTQIRVVENDTVRWDGCIEDASTFRNTDGDPSDEWSPIPNTAYDADIDLVPNSGNPATLFAPLLPDAVWGRYNNYGNTTDTYTTTSSRSRNNSAYCPTQANKLTDWPTASSFDAYVNGLKAEGSTYHDIGLIWGGRFMSPDGMFASENQTTSGGASIQRHMIFMTDGDTSTANENYTAHGISWWDRRQTNSGSAPSTTLLNNVVNARFTAVCNAIKNKNIILWVVSYGGDSNASTEARLESCASPGRYYLANDTPTLIANFKDIANKISALRLTS